MKKISATKTVLNENFKIIVPNEKFDWINQRGNTFENYIALAPEKKFDAKSKSFFIVNPLGIATGRDAFCYNFSRKNLEKNIQMTINFYNENSPDKIDSKKIVWTRATKKNNLLGKKYFYDEKNIAI